MPKRRKTRARANGEGSIYQREITRKNGSTYTRWEAKLTLGYDANGKRKRKTVYGKTQDEVRKKLEAIKHQVTTGTYIEDPRTLADYLTEWLRHKKLEVKPRTHDYYSYYCAKYITPELGGVTLSKLSPAHVRRFMQTMTDKVSADAANKSRVVLNAALNQALRDGLIIRNPVLATKPLQINKPLKDTEWSAAEVVMFLEAARTHRLYAAFYLALSTGMRHGEILGLRWQDIQDDVLHVTQNLITVKHRIQLSTPKTNRGIRKVALDPETLNVLAEHKQRQEAEIANAETWQAQTPEFEGLVFTSVEGGALHPRNFSRVWYDLQAKARRDYIAAGSSEDELTHRQAQIDNDQVLKHIRFHDLRHMHVSLLNKAGVDARTIADRIGHTDPAFTLQRYAHVFEDQRKAAAIPLHRLLLGGDDTTN